MVKAEIAVQNEKAQLFWDFKIYTDYVIETRRYDVVLVEKKTKECGIISIAVPGMYGGRLRGTKTCVESWEGCGSLMLPT